MKKVLFAIVPLSIVLTGCSKTTTVSTATPAPTAVSQASVAPTASPEGSVTKTTEMKASKEVTITAGNFSYDLKEIRVKKGETVKITFKNNEGMHDWVVDEFQARTKKIKAGDTDTVTFVADKAGSFEYYCSVGSHRALGMKGTLIVE
jgi:plastocyanin